jgi:hypothetical protein
MTCFDNQCCSSNQAVLLAVCRVQARMRACGFTHLRYSQRLWATLRQPCSHASLHFRAAAHAVLASDHLWLQRVLRSSQHLPAPLPFAALDNRRLRDSLRAQTSSAWQAARAPYPAADNVSARRHRHGPAAPTVWGRHTTISCAL